MLRVTLLLNAKPTAATLTVSVEGDTYPVRDVLKAHGFSGTPMGYKTRTGWEGSPGWSWNRTFSGQYGGTDQAQDVPAIAQMIILADEALSALPSGFERVEDRDITSLRFGVASLGLAAWRQRIANERQLDRLAEAQAQQQAALAAKAARPELDTVLAELDAVRADIEQRHSILQAAKNDRDARFWLNESDIERYYDTPERRQPGEQDCVEAVDSLEAELQALTPRLDDLRRRERDLDRVVGAA